MPPIRNTISRLRERFISLASFIARPPTPTLRRLYPRTPLASAICVPLVQFPPLSGPCTDLLEHPDVNDPNLIDLDAACFMMLTTDLPALFGIMARPANRKVPVRDLPDFDDWLHVISDPIVVKVYAGSDEQERAAFKDDLVNTLRQAFGMTLICSPDSLTLSRNQVNVPISAMSDALHSLGARVCRVSFFGMKWKMQDAEPRIDGFIQRYRAKMGSSVPTQKNMFDYGIQFLTGGLQLYKFGEAQCEARRFREGTVHEMCNEAGYGSLDFRPILDPHVVKVKVYQVLCHDILSVIQRQMLDDMPATMRTMRTRLRQLQDLMQRWGAMTEDVLSSRISGIRVEVTVHTEMVIDGRRLCSELDLFRIGGLESALGGPFGTMSFALDRFLYWCRFHILAFAAEVHGRDERAPSIRVRNAYTFARQAIGWSGRFMGRQLQEARDWSVVVAQVSTQQLTDQGLPEFAYDGWELDSPEVRPLIQDFLEHAQWFLYSSVRDRSIPGLMLMRPNGRGFLAKKGIYEDRVGAARHYIGLYGADWRDHVRSLQV